MSSQSFLYLSMFILCHNYSLFTQYFYLFSVNLPQLDTHHSESVTKALLASYELLDLHYLVFFHVFPFVLQSSTRCEMINHLVAELELLTENGAKHLYIKWRRLPVALEL